MIMTDHLNIYASRMRCIDAIGSGRVVCTLSWILETKWLSRVVSKLAGVLTSWNILDCVVFRDSPTIKFYRLEGALFGPQKHKEYCRVEETKVEDEVGSYKCMVSRVVCMMSNAMISFGSTSDRSALKSISFYLDAWRYLTIPSTRWNINGSAAANIKGIGMSGLPTMDTALIHLRCWRKASMAESGNDS